MSNQNWIEIANIIGVVKTVDEAKRIKSAKNIVCSPEFDLGEDCGRCGGSGHYSFNNVDGSRCYGCNGVGKVHPKATDSLVEVVKWEVEEGTLNQYIERVNIQKKLKKATDMVFDIWRSSGVSSAYMNYSKAHDAKETINSEMFVINKAYSNLVNWVQTESSKADPYSKKNSSLPYKERVANMLSFWDEFQARIEALPKLPDHLQKWS